MRRLTPTSYEPSDSRSRRLARLAAQGAALLLTALVVLALRLPLAADSIARADPPPPPSELTQFRTASSRTFDNHDGTYTTTAYSGPIHYRDEQGRLQPISSALVPSGAQGYAYENEANRFRALFRQSSGADYLGLETGGARFRLRLQDAAQVSAQTRPRGLSYPQVFSGVDLRYELQPDGVKETLVLANAQVPTAYRFLLSPPPGARIHAVQQSDGSWALYLAPHARPVLVLEAPWLSERGDPTPADPHAALDLTRVGDDFQVDLTLDGRWLRDSQRQFPVRVDPSITIQPPTQDASFDFNCLTCKGTSSDRLSIGRSNISPSPKWRAALQFSLADIPAGASISSATLKLYFDGTCVPISGPTCNGSSHPVEVQRMTNSWSVNSKTSQLAVIAYSPALIYTLPQNAAAQWMNWDVTTTVQSWYSGQWTNYGLLVKRQTEPTASSGPKPPSRNYAPEPTLGPKLEVTYNGNGGELLEPETVHANGAELRWIPYAGPGAPPIFTGYEVHRSGSPNFTPSDATRLTTIRDAEVTSFRDTTAKAGATFTYKVVASGVETNARTVTLPADGQARKTLRPDAAAGLDTYVTERSDSTDCVNRGAVDRLKVGTDAVSIWRSLLSFYLADIPHGAPVSNVTLSLWHPETTSTALTVRVHPLTAHWLEGSGVDKCTGDGATWYEADGGLRWTADGGDFDPAAAASLSLPSGAQAGWSQFSLSPLAQLWADGTQPNLGLLLKLDDETRVAGKSVDFYSSDFAVAPTLRPKLSLTYADESHALAPSVSVAKPSAGTQVSGSAVTIAADAFDDRRVDSVQFFVDGNPVGTDTTAPFSVSWNSTSVGNGSHSLTARATDDAGNQTTSAAVSVSVGNSAPPTTSITDPSPPPPPAPPPTVTGTVPVTATADDDFGVTKVELYADGLLVGTDSAPPDWTFSWNTLAPALPAYDGGHTLTTKAYDTHGQVTTSAPLSVSVDNRGSSSYYAEITTQTPFPAHLAYVRGAPSQEQYLFDVQVMNTGSEPLPAATVVLHYRWLSVDSSDPIVDGDAVSFPFDLQPFQLQTVQVPVEPPDVPADLARTNYRLRFDLEDTQNPGNPWFAGHGNEPLEDIVPVGVLTEEETLGIEPYFEYDTEALGAGLESLVNVATGNSIVRWSPFHAPGIGLSTDLELTYNSGETGPPQTDCGRSHAHCPLGPGWSLSVSSLSRFGLQQFYRVQQGGQTKWVINDADGTAHAFTQSGNTWVPPAGTHLYFRAVTTSVCGQTADFAFTRPDRRTYFYATPGNGQHGWPIAVRDHNNNTLCFIQNDQDDIVTVKDAGEREFQLAYDAHILQSITDHGGHRLVFSYTGGRLTQIVQVGADDDVGCSNARNRCISFTYNGGRLERVYDPLGNFTRFTYNPDGTLWQRFDREDRWTTFTYSPGTRETTVEKPLNRTTVYHYQPDKSVDWIRNALLETTTTEWWPSRHVKKVTEPAPRNGYTEYAYDQNGLVTTEGVLTDANDPGTEDDEVSRTVYEYDHFQVDQYDVNQSISQLKNRTDPNGFPSDPPDNCDDPADPFVWRYCYDGAGNLTRVVDPCPDPVCPETRYEYYRGPPDDGEPKGTLKLVRDQNGHTTTYEAYDTNGLAQIVRQVMDPVDPNDDLVTRSCYDADGLLLWTQDPLHAGETGSDCPDVVESDRDFRTVFDYDPLHRLVEQSSPKGALHLARILIWSETKYDLNDNVTVQRQASYARGSGPETSFQYNNMDQQTMVTDPVDAQTASEYDDAGRLLKTTQPNGVVTPNPSDYVTENLYDRLDRVTVEKRYDENGVPTRRTYSCYQSGSGDLLWVTAPNTDWSGIDEAPNCNPPDPDPIPSHTTRYGYDDGHRQLTETTEAEEGGELRTTSQVYDPNGNVVTEIDEDGTPTQSVYNERDELVQTIETFTKNAQNIPTRELTTAFRYDPVGNLVCEAPPRAWDSGSRCDPNPPPGGEPYITEYRYDESDRQVRIALPTKGTQQRTYIHQAYDENGNLTMTSLPVENEEPPIDEDMRTDLTYWDAGWIRSSNDHVDPVVAFDYTAEGWQSERGGDRGQRRLMSWEYWPDGQLYRAVDPGGRDAVYFYDPDRNVTSATENRGQGQPYEVESEYNGFDEATKTRAKSPQQENWTFTAYRYDRNGNVSRREDDGVETEDHTLIEKGRLNLFGYDWVDEQTRQDELGTDWQDPEPQPSTGDLRLEREYATTGWRTLETLSRFDGDWSARRRTSSAYFANGDLATLRTTDPQHPPPAYPPLEDHTLSYEEEEDGRTVYVNGNRTEDSFTLRGPEGNPTACETTCTTRYRYGVRENLTQETRTGGQQSASCWRYNAAMNLTDEDDHACPVDDNPVRHYEYLVGNRLDEMDDNQQGIVRKYFYDDDGNLACVTRSAQSTLADCTDPYGAPVPSNLEERFGWHYQDRLDSYRKYGVGAVHTTYEHDPFDRLVFEREERPGQYPRETTFTYQGLTSLVSSETSGVETKSYVSDADGQPVALAVTAAGIPLVEQYGYAANVHTDVSLLVGLGDDLGNNPVVASYGYEPYGAEDGGLANGDEDPVNPLNPYRFNAKRYDPGSTTLAMGARRYKNSDIGRFIQQDRLFDSSADLDLATETFTQNRYLYAVANPVRFIEGDGHRPLDPPNKPRFIRRPRPVCPTGNYKQREKCVFAFLVANGLTKAQAAGCVGNLWYESGYPCRSVDPKCMECGENSWTTEDCGVGMGQWTTPERKAALLQFARATLRAPGRALTLRVQKRYLLAELNGLRYKKKPLLPNPALKNNLKKVKGETYAAVNRATRLFMEGFENPYNVHGEANLPARKGEARKVFDRNR